MEMKVRGRKKRGRPKRRWLDKVKDIRDCWRRKCTTVLHGCVCHRTSIQHKSGSNMNRKKEGCINTARIGKHSYC